MSKACQKCGLIQDLSFLCRSLANVQQCNSFKHLQDARHAPNICAQRPLPNTHSLCSRERERPYLLSRMPQCPLLCPPSAAIVPWPLGVPVRQAHTIKARWKGTHRTNKPKGGKRQSSSREGLPIQFTSLFPLGVPGGIAFLWLQSIGPSKGELWCPRLCEKGLES